MGFLLRLIAMTSWLTRGVPSEGDEQADVAFFNESTDEAPDGPDDEEHDGSDDEEAGDAAANSSTLLISPLSPNMFDPRALPFHDLCEVEFLPFEEVVISYPVSTDASSPPQLCVTPLIPRYALRTPFVAIQYDDDLTGVPLKIAGLLHYQVLMATLKQFFKRPPAECLRGFSFAKTLHGWCYFLAEDGGPLGLVLPRDLLGNT